MAPSQLQVTQCFLPRVVFTLLTHEVIQDPSMMGWPTVVVGLKTPKTEDDWTRAGRGW